MKKSLSLAGVVLAAIALLVGCITAPSAPTVVEEVSYDELADKSMMEANDNRLVRVTVQYLGPEVALVPQQALFEPIQDVILVNHSEVGFDYTEEMVSSKDSFLVGFPGDDEYTAMVEDELEIGDTITITGLTEYVNAGFGSFQHLLVNVEDVTVEP